MTWDPEHWTSLSDAASSLQLLGARALELPFGWRVGPFPSRMSHGDRAWDPFPLGYLVGPVENS